MKPFLALCVLTLISSFSYGQTYTLLSSKMSHAPSGELTIESFFNGIIQETFKRAGLGLKIKVQPWVKGQQTVMSAKASQGLLITPLTRNTEREKKYDWILPLAPYKLQFISNETSIDIVDIESLKKIPICVLRESPAQYKLESLGFKEIKAVVRESKCFKALKNRKEKVILAHGQVAAINHYKLVKGDPEELNFGKSFKEEVVYLASTKNAVSAEDKQKLTEALESIRDDGTFLKRLSKYQ